MQYFEVVHIYVLVKVTINNFNFPSYMVKPN